MDWGWIVLPLMGSLLFGGLGLLRDEAKRALRVWREEHRGG